MEVHICTFGVDLSPGNTG